MKILIVEDEVKIGDYLQQGLAEAGFAVDLARNGLDGHHLAMTERYELLILDIMLPDVDGWRILKALRQTGSKVPVLFLTARDSIDDRVKGLELGADDYLVKPFAFPELHARLRALVRRGRGEESVNKLCCADLSLDRLARSAVRAGQPLELTVKEFDLLEFLLRHKGHVVSREMLALEIWGERARVVPLDNVIDVHIARLRAKVDAPFASAIIRTVRGVGFSVQEGDT